MVSCLYIYETPTTVLNLFSYTELPMSNCPEGEFKCKSSVSGSSSGFGGKCILHRFRCDGDNDCGDWSDEEGCPSKMSSCSATEFKCGDGICIPAQWHCDREQDCDSGEDEENCERASVMGVGEARACTKDEFMCQDGRCIIVSDMALCCCIFISTFLSCRTLGAVMEWPIAGRQRTRQTALASVMLVNSPVRATKTQRG